MDLQIKKTKLEEDENSSSKITTINDIPVELLRKILEPLGLKDRCAARGTNKLMENAVATSKWTVAEAKVEIVRREEEFDVNLSVNKLRVTADWTEKFRLCEKLQVKHLEICGAPIEHEKLRFVNGLLTASVPVTLAVRTSPAHQLNEGSHSLIAKTKKVVHLFIKESTPSREEYLALSRPVSFHGGINVAAFNTLTAPENDGLFLELLRRGHNFPQINDAAFTAEVILEAIQIVSNSRVSQNLYISTPLAIGEAFVELVKPNMINEDILDVFPMYKRTRIYTHLDAEITLAKTRLFNNDGRDSYAKFKVLKKIA